MSELVQVPSFRMWNMESLLDASSFARIQILFECMKKILKNPLISKVLEGILADEINVKQFSHCGAVFYSRQRRFCDLGNWKYSFLFCSLARLSRTCCARNNALFNALGERFGALQVNAKYSDKMIEKKGDIIECILAESLRDGVTMEPEWNIWKYEFQRDMRAFDEAVDDSYRLCFKSWTGPPKASQLVNVADFSALVLLSHSMHSLPSDDDRRLSHMVSFNFLSGKALSPLR